MKIKFKKTIPTALQPTRGSKFAACWDLYAPYDEGIKSYYIREDHLLSPERNRDIYQDILTYPVTTIDLGIAIELPNKIPARFAPCGGGGGYDLVAKIYGRSSMGKKGIIIPNSVGIIDSDYRDSLKVMFINVSGKDYKIKSGDRIAQLMVQRYEELEFEEVQELTPTERSGGIGSTGI